MSDIYFEFTRRGRFVKVCAIDGDTGIEISTTCDAKLSEYEMKQHARRVLDRKLKKKKKKPVIEEDFEAGGNGILV